MLSRMQALGRPSSRAFAQRLSTMAYQYSQAGIPSAVISATKLDSPASPPAPGKVVVNWLAAGIDPVDLATLSGAPATSELRPQSFPAVPGTEGVGIVTAVASDITSVKEGDHVIPLKVWHALHYYFGLLVYTCIYIYAEMAFTVDVFMWGDEKLT